MNPIFTQIGCYEGQPFGKNYNPSYHSGGLLGHTGVDVGCGYGTPIGAIYDGLVYSTFPVEHPASDGYTAVFTTCETRLETFEFSYGHVSEINCTIGQRVNKGDTIAKEGNHGTVYAGNMLITLAMQAAGDQRGHHRHYQKRPVIKVLHTQPNKQYLQTAQGIYYDGLYYYEVYDPQNGFAGCVDWTQPLFSRNIGFLSSGYDVYLLQKALKIEGCATFEPTGFFGLMTMNAVRQFQSQNAIQATGYVGLLTRAVLNGKYPV